MKKFSIYFILAIVVLVNCAFGGDGNSSGSGDDFYESPPIEGNEKPSSINTGPNNAASLSTYTGDNHIDVDDTVLENFTFSGTLYIDADNVVIRNFKIDGGVYGIDIEDGHSGIIIEHGEIYSVTSSAILGMGFTAKYLNIYDSGGDGIKPQGTGGAVLVEHCYIHKLGRKDSAHADGSQTLGGEDITYRYNNINNPIPGAPHYPGSPYKSNAAFMLQNNLDNTVGITNVLIEKNWLNGGNYTINVKDTDSSSTMVSNLIVRNNRFGLEFRYGLRAGKLGDWTFENNVWDISGTDTRDADKQQYHEADDPIDLSDL